MRLRAQPVELKDSKIDLPFPLTFLSHYLSGPLDTWDVLTMLMLRKFSVFLLLLLPNHFSLFLCARELQNLSDTTTS